MIGQFNSSWGRPADELSIEVEFVEVRVTAKLVYRTQAKQILAKFMQ